MAARNPMTLQSCFDQLGGCQHNAAADAVNPDAAQTFPEFVYPHHGTDMKTPIRWIVLAMLTALTFSGSVTAAERVRHVSPPGPVGGPGGTHWENPPGWRGGPGAWPSYRYWHQGRGRFKFTVVEGGYYYNPRYGYWHPQYGLWNQVRRCWLDMDSNPPGPASRHGTTWKNPPGWRGGPGASPDHFSRCR